MEFDREVTITGDVPIKEAEGRARRRDHARRVDNVFRDLILSQRSVRSYR